MRWSLDELRQRDCDRGSRRRCEGGDMNRGALRNSFSTLFQAAVDHDLGQKNDMPVANF